MELKTGMCCATCMYAQNETSQNRPARLTCNYHKDFTVGCYQWCDQFTYSQKYLQDSKKKNKDARQAVWKQKRDRAIREHRKQLEAEFRKSTPSPSRSGPGSDLSWTQWNTMKRTYVSNGVAKFRQQYDTDNPKPEKRIPGQVPKPKFRGIELD